MHEYQQRVVDEADALEEKIEKLSNFIESTLYDKLEEIDQQFLVLQLGTMTTYYGILHMRIDRFQE